MSGEVATFYDEYVVQQEAVGVNRRHLRIIDWLRKAGLRENSTVLEVGCGVGTVTSLLAAAVPKGRIVANDISPKSVEAASKRLTGFSQVSFLTGDILGIPIRERSDLIVLPDVLEHIPIEAHRDLLQGLAALLSPEGVLVIHMPSAHYQEWLIVHDRASMQIIDQAVHLHILAPKVAAAGLYLHRVEHYDLWTLDKDAVVIELRHFRTDRSYATSAPEVGPIGKLRRYIFALRQRLKS